MGIVDGVEQRLKPLATLNFNGTTYTFYVGLAAVILNILVAVIATAVLSLASPKQTQNA